MKKSLIFALFSVIYNHSISANNPNNQQPQLTDSQRCEIEKRAQLENIREEQVRLQREQEQNRERKQQIEKDKQKMERQIKELDNYNHLTLIQQRQQVMNEMAFDDPLDRQSGHYGWSGIAQETIKQQNLSQKYKHKSKGKDSN